MVDIFNLCYMSFIVKYLHNVYAFQLHSLHHSPYIFDILCIAASISTGNLVSNFCDHDISFVNQFYTQYLFDGFLLSLTTFVQCLFDLLTYGCMKYFLTRIYCQIIL